MIWIPYRSSMLAVAGVCAPPGRDYSSAYGEPAEEAARGTGDHVTTVEAEPATRSRRRSRTMRWTGTITLILALLFGVPYVMLVVSGQAWPVTVVVIATIVFAGALAAFPWLMFRGHGRGRDGLAIAGDTILGVIWVLFSWSVLGIVARIVLFAAGVSDPAGARIVAGAIVGVAVILLAWGYWEAMRVPRVRTADVRIASLGSGLDGVRVVVLTDTHYGPIDRARW